LIINFIIGGANRGKRFVIGINAGRIDARELQAVPAFPVHIIHNLPGKFYPSPHTITNCTIEFVLKENGILPHTSSKGL